MASIPKAGEAVGVNDNIPWAKPHFWGEEEALIVEALRSTWVSGGPFVDRLEEEMAAILESGHVFAVANGTAAIHLAYLALALEPEDEVVVPAFGFLAAANIALLMGLRPVFADVDPETWCVTAATIAECLSPRTRAVVPVHTYGNVCDLDPIVEMAGAAGVSVVEDNAEALFSTYRGRQAGSLGRLGTFSFQATKTITTGEGGLVATGDESLVERLALYRSHGMAGKRRYWHHVPGHNFRLTNLQAALGCAQLAHRDEIVASRRTMHQRYSERLAGVEGVHLQRPSEGVEMVLWAFAVGLDPDIASVRRDDVMSRMEADGIETRPGFYPPSAMGLYGEVRATPAAERVSATVVSLPSFPSLSEAEIDRVCASLERAIR